MKSTKQFVASLTKLGILALAMLVIGSVKAFAYTDALNGNNTAQITITITPNVDRSVTITTDVPSGMLDLGNVPLTGAFISTQTVSPSTVTIGGTMGNTDLLLSANISGGWTFDASSASLNQNKLATWVSFTDTSVKSAPAQDAQYFRGTDGSSADSALLATDTNAFPATRVGTNAATLPGRFEDDSTSMNGMAVNDQRHMWMFFRMPSDTTVVNQQSITFVLTVDSGI